MRTEDSPQWMVYWYVQSKLTFLKASLGVCLHEITFNASEVPILFVYFICSDWLKSLSHSAISEFQRASELGSELQETWLVCNAAVYLLNYSTHLVAQKRHRELVPILTSVLKNMRSVGHVG